MTSLIKLGIVGVGCPDDLGDSDDGWRISVAVVKQYVIADGHLAQVISGLIVSDTVPAGRLPRRMREIVDRKCFGLRLHKPVPSSCHL
jgi:hypothetical protein